MSKFITWVSKILSSASPESHKRLISIASFAMLVGCFVGNLCGKNIQEQLIYGFFGLCGLQSAFTLFEKFTKNKQE